MHEDRLARRHAPRFPQATAVPAPAGGETAAGPGETPATLRLLRGDHDSFRKLLGYWAQELAVFERGGQPDYDVLGGILDYSLSFSELFHHPLEDLVLRKLRASARAAAAAVGDLEGAHERLARLARGCADCLGGLRQGREPSRDEWHHVAKAYLNAHRRHMDLEERVFFPAAERCLGVADWRDIDLQLAARKDLLFGRRANGHFKALRPGMVALDRTRRESRDRP